MAERPLEPKVVVLPDPAHRQFDDDLDSGDVVFDEESRSILQWMQHPAHRGREGWVLWYPEPDGNGVEDYPIGGRLGGGGGGLGEGARTPPLWPPLIRNP